MRIIVVAGGHGGIASVEQYKEMKSAGFKGDFYVLQLMQAKHKTRLQIIIATLPGISSCLFFEDSNDAMVDYFKKNLFDVAKPGKPWGPIVSHHHQIMEVMMALPPPSLHCVHPAIPHAIPAGAQ